MLQTRAVFDDPAQEFWVLQIGIAGDAVGARRLLARAQEAGGPIWVHDRQYGSLAANPTGRWAVYTGRYESRAAALQALQKFPAQTKVYSPLVRTLGRLRTESYPERAPI